MSGVCAIVDYGSGNLHSAAKAFQRVAAEAGAEILVTADPEAVRRAERIVLPGVGAFADCGAGLRAVPGMWETLEDRVAAGTPFLGICVGMQLMATRGLEHGVAEGFGWIPGEVVRLTGGPGLKIPHMGWNALEIDRAHPVLEGIATGDHAYFVHSYHLKAERPEDVLAHATHGERVTAVVGRGAMVGTQFHPEKSQRVGLRLIANFLRWRP